MKETYLITGVAGFIGYHLATSLLSNGNVVIGIDNINDYYNVKLKEDRLILLSKYNDFVFCKIDLLEKQKFDNIFDQYKPNVVIHLAAQAGVRYSLNNPDAYIQNNIVGFFHVLELCKNHNVNHLYYASSSSVYGKTNCKPSYETDDTNRPISLYAATKKADELLAYTYHHLYGLSTTGLRFFSVYGPWGRPDMIYFNFINKFFDDEAITIYYIDQSDIEILRDFTYIDDVIQSIQLIMQNQEKHKDFEIYNIGNRAPIKLSSFIEIIEKCLSNKLGKIVEFKKNFEILSPCDVPTTFSDNKKLEQAIGFIPDTSAEKGIKLFVDWYCNYFKIT